MTTPSTASVIQIPSLDLDHLNQRFETAHPVEVLGWCLANIPVGLVQASAFSIDDLVITELLYRSLKPSSPVPVLFLDTLHHFAETLELVTQAQRHYGLNLQVYKTPEVHSRAEFAARYGNALWETDVREFHRLTKIEPLQRGLADLGAIAWITGRRRDQATTRTLLPIFEIDPQGRLKVNPLATWTRNQTWAYVIQNKVLYNPLYDQGYASIGDEPLTTPVAAGENERAGRWRGLGKTECGIHIE